MAGGGEARAVRKASQTWGSCRQGVSSPNYLENVGDVVDTAFVFSGYKRLERSVEFDAETRRLLENLAKGTTAEFE